MAPGTSGEFAVSYDYGENRRHPLGRQHWGGGGGEDGRDPLDGVVGLDHAGPDEGPLRLLIVDRKGSFSGEIERAARLLEDVPKVTVLSYPTRLAEEVAAEAPDVVLAAPEEMTVTGLRRLAQVHRAAPNCVIVLTQPADGPPIAMTDAASCGASEVVTYPATTLRLRNALGRILEAAAAAREQVVVRQVVPEAPLPPPYAQPVAAAVSTGLAKVFTVTSPTGGCGKTFFATNLASYLAGATGGRVLLVDLDLQFGEVSLALGLHPKRTIAELINEEHLEEAFPEYVVDHEAGYKVLSAPADPFAAELVGPREATVVLQAARALYDYVVVDTPPSLNEVVLAAFDQSRYLVVMATMDVPSLRNLKVFLETIERLKLPAEGVSCVLNKAEPDNGIDLDELLRVYPGGFAAVLPYAKEVSRSLNIGKPVVNVDPRSEISLRILEGCVKLVPAADIKTSWPDRNPAKAGWAARRRARRAAASVPLGVLQPGGRAAEPEAPSDQRGWQGGLGSTSWPPPQVAAIAEEIPFPQSPVEPGFYDEAPQPVYSEPVNDEAPQPVYAEPAYPEPSYDQAPQPVYAEPVYDEPVYDEAPQPVYDEAPQPVYAEPVYDEPVYDEPVYDEAPQPAYPQPVYAEPAYSQPVYAEPAYSPPTYPAPASGWTDTAPAGGALVASDPPPLDPASAPPAVALKDPAQRAGLFRRLFVPKERQPRRAPPRHRFET
jgi:MinD-like ATPase involved in chromosome partitioning or flagellar assembly/DNA-binding NarL/FixJ family response regulator